MFAFGEGRDSLKECTLSVRNLKYLFNACVCDLQNQAPRLLRVSITAALLRDSRADCNTVIFNGDNDTRDYQTDLLPPFHE